MLGFISLSLFYAFIGVLLIHLYSGTYTHFSALLRATFTSTRYRIYFMLLFIFSLAMLYWLEAGAVYVVLMLLLLLGLIDIQCLALPDVLNFLLLLVCVVFAFLDSMFMQESFIQRVLLGFGVGGVFFTLKIMYQSMARKDIIGEADIIVLSSVGIAFGVLDAFVAVFLGSIVALFYAVVLRVFYKVNLVNLKLPFCFFIFVGVLLNLIWLHFVVSENLGNA